MLTLHIDFLGALLVVLAFLCFMALLVVVRTLLALCGIGLQWPIYMAPSDSVKPGVIDG